MLWGLGGMCQHLGFMLYETGSGRGWASLKGFLQKKVTDFHLCFKRIMLSVVLTKDNKKAMGRNQESSSKTISMIFPHITYK